ncbi:MAG: hypothetical protein ACTHU0_14645, partial [Kofleriaceae bacterium]
MAGAPTITAGRVITTPPLPAELVRLGGGLGAVGWVIRGGVGVRPAGTVGRAAGGLTTGWVRADTGLAGTGGAALGGGVVGSTGCEPRLGRLIPGGTETGPERSGRTSSVGIRVLIFL